MDEAFAQLNFTQLVNILWVIDQRNIIGRMLGRISSSVDQPETLKSIPSALKLLEKLLENDI